VILPQTIAFHLINCYPIINVTVCALGNYWQSLSLRAVIVCNGCYCFTDIVLEYNCLSSLIDGLLAYNEVTGAHL